MAIPMFPTSFPDEYFSSLISRYHVLSGNRSERDTFRQLFGATPFQLLHWVPDHLKEFSECLAGDSATLPRILEENTLLPLLRVFCGFDLQVNSSTGGLAYVGRVPRRSVGDKNATQICEQCAYEDIGTSGMPFFHRSHQIPGTTVCSKHGCFLHRRCPQCHCPFDLHGHLTLFLWLPCVCGHRLGSALASQCEGDLAKPSDVEIQYARFGNALVQHKTRVVSESRLAIAYSEAMLEKGLNRKTMADRIALTAAVEEYYGKELLGKVDYAYRHGRTDDWARIGKGRDMHLLPIQRHLLIANFLFSDAAAFIDAIDMPDDIPISGQSGNVATPKRKTGKRSMNERGTLRAAKRAELLEFITLYPGSCIEMLWEKKRAAMKWLVQNDRKWFDDFTLGLKRGDLSEFDMTVPMSTLAQQKQDAEGVQAIIRFATELYKSSTRPVKASKHYLLTKTNLVQAQAWPARFPKVLAAVSKHAESNWHFYARRMLWALDSFPGDGDVAVSRVCASAGLAYYRSLCLVEYFTKMDLFRRGVLNGGTVMDLLEKNGIGLDWEGPQPWDSFGTPAGRGYILKGRQTRRRGEQLADVTMTVSPVKTYGEKPDVS